MKKLNIAISALMAMCGCAFAERDMAIYRGKLTSDMNANGYAITNAATPTNNSDVATKEYVDTHSGAAVIDVRTNGVSAITSKIANIFSELFTVFSKLSTELFSFSTELSTELFLCIGCKRGRSPVQRICV